MIVSLSLNPHVPPFLHETNPGRMLIFPYVPPFFHGEILIFHHFSTCFHCHLPAATTTGPAPGGPRYETAAAAAAAAHPLLRAL